MLVRGRPEGPNGSTSDLLMGADAGAYHPGVGMATRWLRVRTGRSVNTW